MRTNYITTGLIAALLLFCLLWQCERNRRIDLASNDRRIIEIQGQNLRAATDSIRMEKTKNGLIEAVKSSYIAKIDDLAALNEHLYHEIEITKGRVVSIVTTNTVTEMRPVTIGNDIRHYSDSVTHGLGFQVTQSDAGALWEIVGESRFRLEDGVLNAGKTTISKNRVQVRLTMGFKEVGGNYEVFARSASSAVVIDSLDGVLVIPKVADLNQPVPRKKRFGIGVQAGYGVSIDLKPRPYIGVGIGFNIIRF